MAESIDPNLLESIVHTVLSSNPAIVPLPWRVSYSQDEAAALIGVKTHVLRDARLRGDIDGFKVGKYIFYSRQAVLDFVGDTSA